MKNNTQVAAVTQEGKCLVVNFTDHRIRNMVTVVSKLKTVGIKLAILYIGETAIGTGFSTWNGTNNGIFEQYEADARIGRTNQHCIDNIISNASAYDFTNNKLIAY